VSGFGGSEGSFLLKGSLYLQVLVLMERKLESETLIDKTINAMIVLGVGTYSITKLLTVDHNYWHVSTILY
jgi:protein Mpv17